MDRRPLVFALGLAPALAASAACAPTRHGPAVRVAPTATSVTATTAPATTTVIPACLRVPDDCSLRDVATARDLLVGTAVRATPLRDNTAYRARVVRDFNSVTPESQAKWAEVEPVRGAVDFAAMDALVDFAVQNALRVRGHTLIWDPADGNALPAWVESITNPDALRSVVRDHIRREVGRYAGRVDRWDVVNEPLDKLGPSLAHNHFWSVLGPGYIDLAFASAHDADPNAQLWLNENVFEHLSTKADALVNLVVQLLHQGVPLSGVGLQAHFVSGRAPRAGAIESLVRRLRAQGVQVAITELDIPTTKAGSDAQAGAYRQVVTEAVRGGVNEITVWGVDDANTWLDDFLQRSHTDPLLFDQHDRPKPAYSAVKDALANTQKPHQ